jgi:hypothetical protein
MTSNNVYPAILVNVNKKCSVLLTNFCVALTHHPYSAIKKTAVQLPAIAE